LERRRFPVKELRALASARSGGKTVSFSGESVAVREATAESLSGVDIALFSAGASRSHALAPAVLASGGVVVDNSSAFRMRPDVPLVVPEINAHAMAKHGGIIANPNCAAIILTVAIHPLRQLAGLERIVVSTYQSASGAGARAMEELVEQTRGHLAGNEPAPEVFKWPLAFNLFSHNTDIQENGYNGEENKVIEETRKILEMPKLGVAVTCVRVATLRAHCESVWLEFDRPVSEHDARSVLSTAPGVILQDDRANNHFPMPREASGQDAVFVGRIRRDLHNPNALQLFCAGDQLLKGAALNAVQIAELVTAAR
jgi:aspartate-semialdehyde dehydrogenase